MPAEAEQSEGGWSTFKWATYPNLVEYGLPAVIFIFLLVGDAGALGILKLSDLSNYIPQNPFCDGSVVVSVFGLGWLGYHLRYYVLFPGYTSGKERFYLDVAKVSGQSNDWAKEKRLKLGKFYLSIFYREFPKNIREMALAFHVRWVGLAHISLNVAFSAIILIFAQIMRLALGFLFSPFIFWLTVAHILFFFPILAAARNHRKKCNDQILQILIQKREFLERSMPEFIDFCKISDRT